MSAPSNPVDVNRPADVSRLLDELATLKSELLTMQREQQQELDRYRVEVAAEREERAEHARAGELGREWQTLQRRIDLGETSLDAVVRGEDDSAQAEVVRGWAHENAEVLSAELDSEIAEAEDGREPTAAAEAALQSRAIAAELQAQLARLQTMRFPTP